MAESKFPNAQQKIIVDLNSLELNPNNQITTFQESMYYIRKLSPYVYGFRIGIPWDESTKDDVRALVSIIHNNNKPVFYDARVHYPVYSIEKEIKKMLEIEIDILSFLTSITPAGMEVLSKIKTGTKFVGSPVFGTYADNGKEKTQTSKSARDIFNAGLHGIISSPNESYNLKPIPELGKLAFICKYVNLEKVADNKESFTPSEAIKHGSDYLLMPLSNFQVSNLEEVIDRIENQINVTDKISALF